MNFISMATVSLACKYNVLTSVPRFYSKTSHLATRAFTQNPDLIPLHNAVEKGNKEMVVKVLKSKRQEVNGFDKDGELPIIIAAKKFAKDKNYSSEIAEIIRILHNFGACFLLENKKGESALGYFLEDTNSEMKLVPREVSIEEVKWGAMTLQCNSFIRCDKIGCPNNSSKDSE